MVKITVSYKELKMINYISFQNIMLAVFGPAVFVIVLTTVHRTLQKTLFQGRTAILMALAVSVLCIVGIYQFLGTSGDSSSGPETGNKTNVTLNYILLPYVALAVAILLSQLLLFAGKMLTGAESEAVEKEKKPLGQILEQIESKSKYPGRPKKEKPAEKESKETTKAAASAS